MKEKMRKWGERGRRWEKLGRWGEGGRGEKEGVGRGEGRKVVFTVPKEV